MDLRNLSRETVVVSGRVAANVVLREAFMQTGLTVVLPGRGVNTSTGAIIALAEDAKEERGAVGSRGWVTAYAPLANVGDSGL